ncbi:MAG: hypothetical protein AAFY57_17030 [Cyanobacteria bacterium J06642_2]
MQQLRGLFQAGRYLSDARYAIGQACDRFSLCDRVNAIAISSLCCLAIAFGQE